MPKLLRVAPALVQAILARLARQGEKLRVVGRGGRARPEKMKPEDEAIYGKD